MNVPSSRRVKKWAGLTGLLLAVGLFAAPETAWAGCNHAVSSRSDRLANLHQLHDLFLSGASSTSGNANDQAPNGLPGSPARTPCSGASCSNSQVPLPISTQPGNPDGRDQWGTLGFAPMADHDAFHAREVDEPACSSAAEHSTIFRPPRV